MTRGMVIHSKAVPQEGDVLIYCGCDRSKLRHALPAPSWAVVNYPRKDDEENAPPPVRAKWVLACDTHYKIARGDVLRMHPKAAGTWTTGAAP